LGLSSARFNLQSSEGNNLVGDRRIITTMPLAATVASHSDEGIVEGIHEMGLRGGGNGQAQCCAYVERIMVHRVAPWTIGRNLSQKVTYRRCHNWARGFQRSGHRARPVRSRGMVCTVGLVWRRVWCGCCAGTGCWGGTRMPRRGREIGSRANAKIGRKKKEMEGQSRGGRR